MKRLIIIHNTLPEINILKDSINENTEYYIFDVKKELEFNNFMLTKDFSDIYFIGFLYHTLSIDNTRPFPFFDEKQNNNYFSNKFIEFITYIKNFNENIIIDLLTCNINNERVINDINTVENNHNIIIRYSTDETGNVKGGNWIQESHNINVKNIYFNKSILKWKHNLISGKAVKIQDFLDLKSIYTQATENLSSRLLCDIDPNNTDSYNDSTPDTINSLVNNDSITISINNHSYNSTEKGIEINNTGTNGALVIDGLTNAKSIVIWMKHVANNNYLLDTRATGNNIVGYDSLVESSNLILFFDPLDISSYDVSDPSSPVINNLVSSGGSGTIIIKGNPIYVDNEGFHMPYDSDTNTLYLSDSNNFVNNNNLSNGIEISGLTNAKSVSFWYYFNSSENDDNQYYDGSSWQNVTTNDYLFETESSGVTNHSIYFNGNDNKPDLCFINGVVSSSNPENIFYSPLLRNKWICISFVLDTIDDGSVVSFDKISLFNNLSFNSQLINGNIGPIKIYDSVIDLTEHTNFYEQYRSHYETYVNNYFIRHDFISTVLDFNIRKQNSSNKILNEANLYYDKNEDIFSVDNIQTNVLASDNEWKCISIISNNTFSKLTLFNNYQKNSGINVCFGPIRVYNDFIGYNDHLYNHAFFSKYYYETELYNSLIKDIEYNDEEIFYKINERTYGRLVYFVNALSTSSYKGNTMTNLIDDTTTTNLSNHEFLKNKGVYINNSGNTGGVQISNVTGQYINIVMKFLGNNNTLLDTGTTSISYTTTSSNLHGQKIFIDFNEETITSGNSEIQGLFNYTGNWLILTIAFDEPFTGITLFNNDSLSDGINVLFRTIRIYNKYVSFSDHFLITMSYKGEENVPIYYTDPDINLSYNQGNTMNNLIPWERIGYDIDGEYSDDRFGYSLAMSSDGTIIAAGSIRNDDNGTDAGHVRIYEYRIPTSTEWTTVNIAKENDVVQESGKYYWIQKGADLDGEAVEDQSGHSVALSSDGSIIAIGANQNDGNGTNSGHTRIYEWDGSSWVQKGLDIDGEANEDFSGYSVSLSSDGLIVAIGARVNDGINGINSGHVRIYEWDVGTTSWIQKGSDLDGEAAYDYFGSSISLSSNGDIIAIGAIYNDAGNLDNTTEGSTSIYEWDGSSWSLKGEVIYGEAYADESGTSVSLSLDGSIIAIGARKNDGEGDGIDDKNRGHVRIYNYKIPTDDEWTLGNVIKGSDVSQQIGKYYWTQLGNDIDGEAGDIDPTGVYGDLSGHSVSLSDNGYIVAIGGYYNDAGDSVSTYNKGHIRVYEYKIPSDFEWNYGNIVKGNDIEQIVGKYYWIQKGNDIDGENWGDLLGAKVSLSADGSIVAGSATLNDGSGSASGHVRVYKFTEKTTTFSGDTFSGDYEYILNDGIKLLGFGNSKYTDNWDTKGDRNGYLYINNFSYGKSFSFWVKINEHPTQDLNSDYSLYLFDTRTALNTNKAYFRAYSSTDTPGTVLTNKLKYMIINGIIYDVSTVNNIFGEDKSVINTKYGWNTTDWLCITVILDDSEYFDEINFFTDYERKYGMNVSFGPIKIYNSTITYYEHIRFYNEYNTRYNLEKIKFSRNNKGTNKEVYYLKRDLIWYNLDTQFVINNANDYLLLNFNEVIDGNGYTISIKNDTNNYGGIFKSTGINVKNIDDAPIIRNLNVNWTKNWELYRNLSQSSNAQLIVGKYFILDKCFVSGYATTNTQLISKAPFDSSYVIIRNCIRDFNLTNNVTISNIAFFTELAQFSTCYISNCYINNELFNFSNSGFICGGSDLDKIIIENCFSLAKLTENTTGSITSDNFGTSNKEQAIIKNCFGLAGYGTSKGLDQTGVGLVGENSNTKIINSFVLTNNFSSSSVINSINSYNQSTVSSLISNIGTNWDTNIWEAITDDYPRLKVFNDETNSVWRNNNHSSYNYQFIHQRRFKADKEYTKLFLQSITLADGTVISSNSELIIVSDERQPLTWIQPYIDSSALDLSNITNSNIESNFNSIGDIMYFSNGGRFFYLFNKGYEFNSVYSFEIERDSKIYKVYINMYSSSINCGAGYVIFIRYLNDNISEFTVSNTYEVTLADSTVISNSTSLNFIKNELNPDLFLERYNSDNAINLSSLTNTNIEALFTEKNDKVYFSEGGTDFTIFENTINFDSNSTTEITYNNKIYKVYLDFYGGSGGGHIEYINDIETITENINLSTVVDSNAPSITSISTNFGDILNLSESNNIGIITIITQGIENLQTLTVNLNSKNYSAFVFNNQSILIIPLQDINSLTNDTTYTITVNGTDKSGNSAIAQTKNFIVKKSIPIINSILPSWDTTLDSIEDNTDQTITINTTNVEDNQIVTILLNSITYTGTINNNSSTITIPFNDLETLTDDTYYTITANVTDQNNNSNELTYVFYVDKTIISIDSVIVSWGTTLNSTEDDTNGTITVNTSGSTTGDNVSITLNSITYTGNLIDNSVVITIPNTDLQNLTNNTNYNININILDVSSNIIATITKTFNVDTTLPTIDSISFSWGNILNINQSNDDGSITINTTDIEDNQIINVNINNNDLQGVITSNTSTITISNTILSELTESSYTITINSSDTSGNTVSDTFTLNTDKISPTIISITPSWLDTLDSTEDNSDQTVTIITDGVEDSNTINLEMNNQTYTGTVTSNSSTIIIPATDLQALADDTRYTIICNVSDSSGNISPDSEITFTVDTTVSSITYLPIVEEFRNYEIEFVYIYSGKEFNIKLKLEPYSDSTDNYILLSVLDINTDDDVNDNITYNGLKSIIDNEMGLYTFNISLNRYENSSYNFNIIFKDGEYYINFINSTIKNNIDNYSDNTIQLTNNNDNNYLVCYIKEDYIIDLESIDNNREKYVKINSYVDNASERTWIIHKSNPFYDVATSEYVYNDDEDLDIISVNDINSFGITNGMKSQKIDNNHYYVKNDIYEIINSNFFSGNTDKNIKLVLKLEDNSDVEQISVFNFNDRKIGNMSISNTVEKYYFYILKYNELPLYFDKRTPFKFTFVIKKTTNTKPLFINSPYLLNLINREIYDNLNNKEPDQTIQLRHSSINALTTLNIIENQSILLDLKKPEEKNINEILPIVKNIYCNIFLKIQLTNGVQQKYVYPFIDTINIADFYNSNYYLNINQLFKYIPLSSNTSNVFIKEKIYIIFQIINEDNTIEEKEIELVINNADTIRTNIGYKNLNILEYTTNISEVDLENNNYLIFTSNLISESQTFPINNYYPTIKYNTITKGFIYNSISYKSSTITRVRRNIITKNYYNYNLFLSKDILDDSISLNDLFNFNTSGFSFEINQNLNSNTFINKFYINDFYIDNFNVSSGASFQTDISTYLTPGSDAYNALDDIGWFDEGRDLTFSKNQNSIEDIANAVSGATVVDSNQQISESVITSSVSPGDNIPLMSDGSSIQLKFTDIDGTEVIINLKQSGDTLETSTYIYKTDTVGLGSLVTNLQIQYEVTNYLLDSITLPADISVLNYSQNAIRIYSENPFQFILTDPNNNIFDLSFLVTIDPSNTYYQVLIHNETLLFFILQHNVEYTITIKQDSIADKTTTITINDNTPFVTGEAYTSDLVNFNDTLTINKFLNDIFVSTNNVSNMMEYLKNNYNVENTSDLNIVEHNNEKIFVTEDENIVIDGETISLSSIFNTTIERTTKLRKYIISGYGYNGSGIGSIVVEPTTYALFNYLLDNSVYPSTTDIELSENALIIYSGNSFTFTLTDSNNTTTDISSVIENDVTGNFNELIIYDLSILFRDVLHNKTYTATISRTGLPDVTFTLTLKVDKEYDVSEGYTTNPSLVTFADTIKLNNYLYRKYLDNTDLTGMMNNLIANFTVENMNNINLTEDTTEDIIFVTENDSLSISGTLVNLENIFNDKTEITTYWNKKITFQGYGYGGSGIGLITITSSLPCFTGETKILTIDGYKEIKYIKKDDLVLTDRNKLVKVVNVMKRRTKLKSERPYKIEKNHYGKLPLDDIYISPLHAYKKGKEWTKAIYEKELKQVNKESNNEIMYYNLELPDYRNDNLVCSGIVCESWSNKQKGFKWIKNVRTNKINRINL